jgi:hypothetical protein
MSKAESWLNKYFSHLTPWRLEVLVLRKPTTIMFFPSMSNLFSIRKKQLETLHDPGVEHRCICILDPFKNIFPGAIVINLFTTVSYELGGQEPTLEWST